MIQRFLISMVLDNTILSAEVNSIITRQVNKIVCKNIRMPDKLTKINKYVKRVRIPKSDDDK